MGNREQAEFDRDIAVRRTDEKTYAAELAPGWVVGGGLNGGYLLAVIANALRAHLPNHPDPIVLSAFYAGASTPGPAEGARTTWNPRSRSFASTAWSCSCVAFG